MTVSTRPHKSAHIKWFGTKGWSDKGPMPMLSLRASENPPPTPIAVPPPHPTPLCHPRAQRSALAQSRTKTCTVEHNLNQAVHHRSDRDQRLSRLDSRHVLHTK